ncbi:MAG: hypothetical protein CMN32_06430 [Saprospirales bacterium]|nr:hypothetical protein [Saprospirales bacterium]
MDILTHIVIGASSSVVLFEDQLGKRTALVGGLAALVPDVDTLLTLFYDQADSLLLHRGLSHSIFFILFLSASTSILLRLRNNSNPIRWGMVVFVALTSHVLLDVMTSYGTRILHPFSDSQFSIGNINVVDPVFTVPALMGLLLYLFSKKAPSKRKIANLTGLGISLIYAMLTLFNYLHVKHLFIDTFARANIVPERVVVIPSSAGSFYWHGIAVTSAGWVVGDYSVFDKDNNISLVSYQSDNSLLNSFDTDIMEKVMRYVDGVFLTREEEGKVRVYHLKCHLTQGYELDPSPSTAFIELSKSDEGRTILESKMMVTKTHDKQLFTSRWKRVFGHKLSDVGTFTTNPSKLVQ